MNRIISALLLSLTASLAGNTWAADAPTAAAQSEARNDRIEVADNAPDSYVVVKGDTLWGISGKFLKQPWRWPEVWRLNKSEIRNPHLIYPGQVIMLDRNGPYLSVGKRVGDGKSTDVKLSPQAYATPADSPIATVPMDLIRQFLVEPLVDELPDSETKPTIVAMQQERVLAGKDDTVFAKNVPADIDRWQIYRRSTPLRDPVTNAIIAYEALVVGKAQLTAPAATPTQAATLMVTDSNNEINIGMRLAPVAKEEVFAMVPHSAPDGVAARVISITGGVAETGRMGVVAIDAGKAVGLEPGHVFAVHRHRGTVKYTLDGKVEQWDLPDERYGLLFVFRVFNKVSYALVLESNLPVRVGDDVRAP